MIAVVLWFIGLLALLGATLAASARARALPADVVGRGVIATAAVAYVGIVVAAVWTWGGATAAAGRATQLRDGALVRLSIDGVRLPIGSGAVIGHAEGAVLRVPGSGPDLVRIEPAGQGEAAVRGPVLAVVHGGDAAVRGVARGCAASEAAYGLPVGASVAAIECNGNRPVRAFVVHNAG